jgi:hypothetical protein
MERPMGYEARNPLALKSLDEHPEVMKAGETVVRYEQALTAAKEALDTAQQRQQAAEGERITALMSREPGGTGLLDATFAATSATGLPACVSSRRASNRAVDADKRTDPPGGHGSL